MERLPITRVVVHPDGARVTRSGSLRTTHGRLKVCGLPLLIDEQSLSVQVAEQQVSGVRVALDLTQQDRAEELPARQKVLDAQQRFARLELERKLLRQQRERLVRLKPGGPSEVSEDASAPVPKQLRVWAKLSPEIELWAAKLDERLHELKRLLKEAKEELQLAKDALSRVSFEQRWSRWTPSRCAMIELAGGQDLEVQVSLSYRVDGALWTPAYALKLTSDSKSAVLSMRALVAQVTGEDWPPVGITLSTAPSRRRINVPELPALRWGARASSSRQGWRPLPSDLDSLFPDELGLPGGLAVASAAAAEAWSVPEAEPEPEVFAGGAGPALEEGEAGAVFAAGEGAGSDVLRSAPAAAAPMFTGAAPPPPAMAAPARMAAPAPMATSRGRRHAARPKLLAEEAPLTPRSDVLNYSRLRVAGIDLEPGVRGRLHPVSLQEEASERAAPEPGVRRVQQAANHLSEACRSLKRRKLPPRHVLPKPIQGIAYAYPSQGQTSIRSNGEFHNLAVESREVDVRYHYRVVPRDDLRVYRRVSVGQLAGMPLLPGPADILLDGRLLRTVPFAGGAQGETLRFDIGVEDGIKVVRNVRYGEESAGLLKGRRVIHTQIDVEVASSLNAEVELELLERLPIAGDSETKVELVSSEPGARPYKGEPGGEVLKGGQLQLVQIQAGGHVKANLTYAVRIPADMELVGGDRRA